MSARRTPPTPPKRLPGGGPDGFRWADAFERLAGQDDVLAGEWVIVDSFDHPRRAEQIKYRIDKGRIPLPGGRRRWEIVQEKVKGRDGKIKGSRLWARMKVKGAHG